MFPRRALPTGRPRVRIHVPDFYPEALVIKLRQPEGTARCDAVAEGLCESGYLPVGRRPPAAALANTTTTFRPRLSSGRVEIAAENGVRVAIAADVVGSSPRCRREP